jgi:endonuclease/exonuclease/phosphatase family metal-dependent hydrolase
MKRYLLSAAALCFAMAMSAQSLFVGSYNIRYHNSDDDRNGNVWKTRCKVICDQVNFESPDIFGAQEVLHAQLGDLLGALDGYDYIGVGRDNGKTKGEYAAIFYKKDRVKLLNKGNFWLNETPDKPKLGWDAACIRICSWGEFEQAETGFRFYYFNLHMDHVGVVARREAAKLVVKKIGEIAKGAPVVLTGDFNVDQNDEIYRIFTSSGILTDSYTHARLRFAENGTFNDYKPYMKTQSRIDHVFVSPEFNVDRYGMLTNMYWTDDAPADAQNSNQAPSELEFRKMTLRTPSDHYPVFVRINYKK